MQHWAQCLALLSLIRPALPQTQDAVFYEQLRHISTGGDMISPSVTLKRGLKGCLYNAAVAGEAGISGEDSHASFAGPRCGNCCEPFRLFCALISESGNHH